MKTGPTAWSFGDRRESQALFALVR